jgi:hypothetical protein
MRTDWGSAQTSAVGQALVSNTYSVNTYSWAVTDYSTASSTYNVVASNCDGGTTQTQEILSSTTSSLNSQIIASVSTSLTFSSLRTTTTSIPIRTGISITPSSKATISNYFNDSRLAFVMVNSA